MLTNAVLSKQFERSRLQSKPLLSNCFGLGFSTTLQGARLECRIATATSVHDTSDIGVKPIPVEKAIYSRTVASMLTNAVLSKQFERSRLQSKPLLSNCFGLGFSTTLQGARLECRIATATSVHDTSDIGVKPIPVEKAIYSRTVASMLTNAVLSKQFKRSNFNRSCFSQIALVWVSVPPCRVQG